MPVDASRRPGKTRLERTVETAHRLPIRFEFRDGAEVEAGVALGVRERGDERGQRGLARRSCHRGRGGIHGIGARGSRGQQRRELSAGGVVRVHMHRELEAVA
mgnify:CR=1 FL=1